ncbi:MAG: hypothetical protein M1358_04505 [Chloroflexi bacterium]|nr:hypothetical protein [Chloroflexota bacterium]
MRKAVSAKSVGLLAAGYARLYHATQLPLYEQECHRAIGWLLENRLSGYSGACWGYPFDVYSRSTVYLAGTPTVVATSFIAQAFVAAYEQFGDDVFLSTARSACDYVLKDLPAIVDAHGICIPYHAAISIPVHNANLLGVALLSRVYRHTQEKILLDYAQRAIRYTLSFQRPDGAWSYGEHEGLRWVDSFHTGFILDSIHHYVENTGDDWPLAALNRGVEYYEGHFFLQNGAPKYTDRSLYPIDVRCASQAIQTLSLLSDRFPQGKGLACKVAHWAITHLQDPKGYFYYQINRLFVNKTPYIRWSQGPMLCGLATLLDVGSAANGSKLSHKVSVI